MNKLLILAFLFYIGSHIGWIIELLFRHYFSSSNTKHKWINPGFCAGPYLPIYGVGLCVLYLLAEFAEIYSIERWMIFIFMAISMTLIEYIGGLFFLKTMNLRLWDYHDMWGNIQGLICPLFSFFWCVLGGVYYFFIHSYVLESLNWLSSNLAFSFFIGLFFGVFIIDLIYSSQALSRLKKFAKDHDVIMHVENIKVLIHSLQDEIKERASFLFPFRTVIDIKEKLIDELDLMEKRRKKHH